MEQRAPRAPGPGQQHTRTLSIPPSTALFGRPVPPDGMSYCPSYSLRLEGIGQHAHQAGRGPVTHQGSLRAAAAGNSKLAEQFGFQSLEGRDLLCHRAPRREGSHVPPARRVLREAARSGPDRARRPCRQQLRESGGLRSGRRAACCSWGQEVAVPSGPRCGIPIGSVEERAHRPRVAAPPKAASRAQGEAGLAGTRGPRPLTELGSRGPRLGSRASPEHTPTELHGSPGMAGSVARRGAGRSAFPRCDGLTLRPALKSGFRKMLEKAFAHGPWCSAARGRQCAQAGRQPDG